MCCYFNIYFSSHWTEFCILRSLYLAGTAGCRIFCSVLSFPLFLSVSECLCVQFDKIDVWREGEERGCSIWNFESRNSGRMPGVCLFFSLYHSLSFCVCVLVRAESQICRIYIFYYRNNSLLFLRIIFLCNKQKYLFVCKHRKRGRKRDSRGNMIFSLELKKKFFMHFSDFFQSQILHPKSFLKCQANLDFFVGTKIRISMPRWGREIVFKQY